MATSVKAVITDQNNKPIVKVPCALMDGASRAQTSVANSDANGLVSFTGLTAGTYWVKPLVSQLTKVHYIETDSGPITGLSAGNDKEFYSSHTGVVTELPLGTAGTAMVSNGATSAPTMQAISLNPHGPSNHNDQTRSIWLPSQAWSLDGGTRVERGTTPALYSTIQLADGVTQGTYTLFQMPNGKTSSDISIVVVVAGDGSASADVRLQTNSKVVTVSGSNALAASTVKTSTLAGISATTDTTSFKNFLLATGATPAETDLIRVQFQRLGADAADTYTGNLFFLGAYLLFTADQ